MDSAVTEINTVKSISRRDFLKLGAVSLVAYLTAGKIKNMDYLNEIETGLEFMEDKAEAATERIRRKQLFADLQRDTDKLWKNVPEPKTQDELIKCITETAALFHIGRYAIRLKYGEQITILLDPESAKSGDIIYPPASCLKLPVLSQLMSMTEIQPAELSELIYKSNNDTYKAVLGRLPNGLSQTTDGIIRSMGYHIATSTGELPIYMNFSEASRLWENLNVNPLLIVYLNQLPGENDYYGLAKTLDSAHLPPVLSKIGYNWLPNFKDKNKTDAPKYFWNNYFTEFPSGVYLDLGTRLTGTTCTDPTNDLNSYLFMDVVHGMVGKYLISKKI